MGEYTAIAAGRQDADSPIDEDLIQDLSEHGDYNYDHGLRCGTDAAAVRLAMARGSLDFTQLSGTSINNIITFNAAAASGGAIDGDPNFDSAPTVWVSLREHASTTTQWANLIATKAFIEDGYPTSTVVHVGVYLFNGGGATSYQGYIDWLAIGPVTSGE